MTSSQLLSSLAFSGVGMVNVQGWGKSHSWQALEQGNKAPDGAAALRVAKPSVPMPWGRNARMRRASPISKFALYAALEALGLEKGPVQPEQVARLGVIATVMNGAVQYSARFFGELLEQPRTASPLLFPETVFNAPGSHLASVLGADGPSATLVGDPAAQCISALQLAARWLEENPQLEGVLLVGMEEYDQLVEYALGLYDSKRPLGEGAAALYLTRWQGQGIRLNAVKQSFAHSASALKKELSQWHEELGSAELFLSGGYENLPRERALSSLIRVLQSKSKQQYQPARQLYGELCGASSVSALALAAYCLQQRAASSAWVLDAGVMHTAFLLGLEAVE